jgi:hypothetical protein
MQGLYPTQMNWEQIGKRVGPRLSRKIVGKERGLERITRGSSSPCTKLINGFILYGDMAPNCAATASWNSHAPEIYALRRNIKHIMHSLGSSRKLATQCSLEFSNKCVVWNSFASLIILDNLQSKVELDINQKSKLEGFFVPSLGSSVLQPGPSG